MLYNFQLLIKSFLILNCFIIFYNTHHIIHAQELSQWDHKALLNTTVKSLALTSNYIFAATSNRGIVRLNPQNFDPHSCGFENTDKRFVRALATDNEDIIYAATKRGCLLNVDIDNDSCETWKLKNGVDELSLPDTPDLQSITIFPNNIDIVIVGNAEGRFFYSTSKGDTWFECSDSLPSMNSIRSLIFPSPMSQRILLGSSDGIFENKLNCINVGWVPLNQGLGDNAVQFLTVSPGDTNTIYAGTVNGVFRTMNGGAFWESYGFELDGISINDIEIHPDNYQILFAATDGRGVYKSFDGGNTWREINAGLAEDHKEVNDLAISANRPNELLAGTERGGLYQYINSPPDIPELQIPSHDSSYSDSTIQFEWISPHDNDQDPLNFIIEFWTDDTTFCFKSSENPSKFKASDPPPWEAGTQIMLKNEFHQNNIYSWRVKALDGIDTTFSETREFIIDTEPPEMIFVPPDVARTAGSGISLQAQVKDNFTGIDSLELIYRRGGESDWQRKRMISVEVNSSGYETFRETIPDSFVGKEGLAYYIEARDGVSNITRMPDPTTLPFYSIHVKIDKNNIQTPFTLPSEGYELISVPLISDNPRVDSILVDDLGLYDPSRYRVVDWEFDFVDYAEDGRFIFAPGKGYWIRSRDPGKIITAGPGKTALLNQKWEIQLQGGWNIIGNPFHFPIPSKNLTLSTGESLDSYLNFTDDAYTHRPDYIMPWKGYFLHVDSRATLFVDPGLSIENDTEANQPVSLFQWSIQILAESNGHSDRNNYLGILKEGVAPQDVNAFEAPRIQKSIAVYFKSKEESNGPFPLTTDFRGINEMGDYWDILIDNPGENPNFKLTFYNIETVPAKFDVVLIDPELNVSYDLRRESETVLNSSRPDLNKEIRIIVGVSDFVAENDINIGQIPEDYQLFQNYPNPFNPVTTIRFAIPKPDRVSLKIYNVLGHHIATLIENKNRAAGIYSIQWDGKNDRNEQLESGVYFYILETPNYRKINKMILIQ